METKLFELRDHATFIPLLCIKPQVVLKHAEWCNLRHEDVVAHRPCSCRASFEAKMAWRYGYKEGRVIIAMHLGSPERGCHADPFAWGDRTFAVAHLHIQDHWDELKTGDLIDVRVILGETDEPCPSEA